VLLLEFNELTPALLQSFMADGSLPHFRRLYERSTAYTTTAGDDPLEPWVQWPTVHCGVPFAEHGARYLGEGRAIAFPGIARVLSDAGVVVGDFGTINANYRDLRGYCVPDPWNDDAVAQPAELRPYVDFVARAVRENTREALPSFTVAEACALALCMIRNGVTLGTFLACVGQLVRERVRPADRYRRVFALDRVQYDIFRALNARFDVGFAAFFSNSTAHLQHYYWRNMAPHAFAQPLPAGDDAALRSAVRNGYRAMDALLGRVVHDHPRARVILCTGLSQEAWPETTKCTYRPRDFGAMLAFAGCDVPVRVRPVMAERFRVVCATVEHAEAAAAALARVTSDGAPLMGVERRGTIVYAGCDVIETEDRALARSVRNGAGDTRPFGSLFYRITGMNSGRHHADGALWIAADRHTTIARKLPLAHVAALVLEECGVPPAPTMHRARASEEARAVSSATE
jgi:hypothetical protein